jgi:hypothetical protein
MQANRKYDWKILGFIVILLGSISCMYADDTSLGYGTTASVVSPVNNPYIIMKKANIKVKFDWYESKVSCEFVFINSGPDTTVLMGFPKRECLLKEENGFFIREDVPPEYETSENIIIDNEKRKASRIVYDITNFTTTIDSNVIEQRFAETEENRYSLNSDEALKMIKQYYIWEVNFKKGERKTLKHSYLHKNMVEERSAFFKTGWSQFEYILQTGKTWKEMLL